MDRTELWAFEVDLKNLIDFFVELHALEPTELCYGYGQAAKLDTYEKGRASLDRFSKNFSSLLAHVSAVQRFAVFPKLDDLPKVEFSHEISAINAAIKIAVKQNTSGGGGILEKILGAKSYSVFSIYGSNKNIYVELDRLSAAVSVLIERHEELSAFESKEFQPGNVSKETLIHHIGSTLKSIKESSRISPQEKKQLVSLLEMAASQVSSSNTKWINVVGVITLVLGILQAIAVAPDAYSNAKHTYDYLMRAAGSEAESNFLRVQPGLNQIGESAD